MKAAETNRLEPICAFLKSLTLERVSPKNEQNVVVLYEQMSLEQALLALASRHILSAPVMTGRAQDEGSGDGTMQFCHDRDVVGFLDIRDILLNFLGTVGPVHELLKMPMLTRMNALEQAGAVFSRKLVSEIHLYGSDGNFLHSGRTGVSLWELVYSSLLHPSRRNPPNSGRTSAVHHRIALFDSTYRITQIISQTDVMRALHSGKGQLQDCLQIRLLDIPGLCSSSLVAMSAHKSALEALAMMHKHDVSAVAVVDTKGRLMGSFSMSAMRSIVVEHFGALALPVAEFLALACGEPGAYEYVAHLADELKEVEGSSAGGRNLHYVRGSFKRSRPGSCDGGNGAYLSKEGTVEDMLELIMRRRVHRVYIVAADGKPLATATLTDLLYSIAGEQPTGRPQL